MELLLLIRVEAGLSDLRDLESQRLEFPRKEALIRSKKVGLASDGFKFFPCDLVTSSLFALRSIQYIVDQSTHTAACGDRVLIVLPNDRDLWADDITQN